jgi:hypothetical protein
VASGGSDVGNGGAPLRAKDGGLVVTLPPLATVVLQPA